MKMNASMLLFLSSLIIGSLISISSTSWFGVWAGLELNLLSFIPLMMQPSKFSAEASLKYFLTQALASALLLAGIIWKTSTSGCMLEGLTPPDLAMMTALLIKMGAAPMHFWFPEVASGLGWYPNMILMTWQKIAPFVILMYLGLPTTMLTLAAGLSAITGALGGFNQTSLRKILAFSSINHMAWMLVATKAGQMFWLIYFLVYSIMTLVMMSFFFAGGLNSLVQLSNYIKNYPLGGLLISLNMLSMGGLPPFTGFMPKWMMMEYMMSNSLYILAAGMIFMTLIVLYFYLRLTYAPFMFFNSTLKLSLGGHKITSNMLLWASVMGLMVGPAMIMI